MTNTHSALSAYILCVYVQMNALKAEADTVVGGLNEGIAAAQEEAAKAEKKAKDAEKMANAGHCGCPNSSCSTKLCGCFGEKQPCGPSCGGCTPETCCNIYTHNGDKLAHGKAMALNASNTIARKKKKLAPKKAKKKVETDEDDEDYED